MILGCEPREPLQFWWGPLSPALLIVLLVIVGGALLVLTRVGLLAVAVLFWFTFATALGILALSGHAFSANWHLGPVADDYFWKVLVLSPEVFIFLAFMITDPRTAPETARGRRIYSVAIGLLGALLIAPMQTEYWAKVALLVSLTIVCAARPVVILAREALERRRCPASARRRAPAPQPVPARLPRRRRRRGVRGAPRRRRQPGPLGRDALLERARRRRRGHDRAHAERRLDLPAARAGRSRATPSRTFSSCRPRSASATRRRRRARQPGPTSRGSRPQIAKAAGRPIVVPSYRVATVDLRLLQAVDQSPPTVVATLTGKLTPLTYAVGSTKPQSGQTAPFKHVFDLALTDGRFLLVGEGATQLPLPAPVSQPKYASQPKGVGGFAKLRLVNVAPKLGLDFQAGGVPLLDGLRPRRR